MLRNGISQNIIKNKTKREIRMKMLRMKESLKKEKDLVTKRL